MANYLSEAIFREVVESFDWPTSYTIENDLPDGMILKLPNCSLYFAEGLQADIRLEFLPENTGATGGLGLAHAMMVIPPGQAVQGLHRDESPYGSAEKARHGVHDICATVIARLGHVLRGDFSWVARYQAISGGRGGSGGAGVA